VQFRLDQLGKNILRDFFVLVGKADTEVEVPPGDGQRIDVWHAPDPALLLSHPEFEPGLLRILAEEEGAVEVWSDAPDEADFHGVVRKRYGWHHVLELREKARLPLTSLCLLCAGRPTSVLAKYGFEEDRALHTGVYVTNPPAWRIRVVVIGELPRVRGTILFRLLGSLPVRRLALRDLAALPEGAWERRVALPWLIRLCFEVPVEGLAAGEKDFIMETREWYEEWRRKNVDEPLREARQEALAARQEALAARHAQMAQQAQQTTELFEMRLGRPTTEAERATLAERLRTLGQQRVGAVVLELGAEATAAWLADPSAR
jgi:hypothetical protein